MEMAVDARRLSPLALAYIGDAVYEMYVRKHLIEKGITRVNDLHKSAVKYVKATTQAQAVHLIESKLSEEEFRIVKRGRNAKSGQTPKNTDVVEYRYSTGFESLIGYLYLNGEIERLEEIFKIVVAFVEEGE